MADTKKVISDEAAELELIKVIKEGNETLEREVKRWGQKSADFDAKISNMEKHLEGIQTEQEAKILEFKAMKEELKKEQEEMSGKSADEIAEIKAKLEEQEAREVEIKKMIETLAKSQTITTADSKDLAKQVEDVWFDEMRLKFSYAAQNTGNANMSGHIKRLESLRENNQDAIKSLVDEHRGCIASPFSIEGKAYTAGTYSSSGALIMPYQVMAGILNTNVQELSPMRQLCDVSQVTGPGEEFNIKTSHAVALRRSETGTQTEDTSINFAERKIRTHEMSVYYIVTHEMLEDSKYDLRADFREEVANAIAVKEGTETISGTGAGEFMGLGTLAAAGTISYKPTGVSASIESPDYLMEAVLNLKQPYHANTSWITRRANVPKFIQLKNGMGQYFADSSFIVNYDVATRKVMLMGYPVYLHPDVAAWGADAYVAYYGDFKKGYKIIDRVVGVTFIEDPYSSKTTGRVEFFVRYRNGADYKVAEAINALKASAS